MTGRHWIVSIGPVTVPRVGVTTYSYVVRPDNLALGAMVDRNGAVQAALATFALDYPGVRVPRVIITEGVTL